MGASETQTSPGVAGGREDEGSREQRSGSSDAAATWTSASLLSVLLLRHGRQVPGNHLKDTGLTAGKSWVTGQAEQEGAATLRGQGRNQSWRQQAKLRQHLLTAGTMTGGLFGMLTCCCIPICWLRTTD